MELVEPVHAQHALRQEILPDQIQVKTTWHLAWSLSWPLFLYLFNTPTRYTPGGSKQILYICLPCL